MDKDDGQVAMQIIFYAGNAKSAILQAIDAAFLGNQKVAKDNLAIAKKALNDAHNIQSSLMTTEINGRLIKKTIILIHAQDQFMAADTLIELGERLINIADRIGLT